MGIKVDRLIHLTEFDFYHAIVLAEVLRLQRWAGGESVPAARIFGLMHGFESVLRQETESFGFSEDTQEKVEDLLEDVEAEKQSTDGMSIKDRLRRDGIDEIDALCVMELCRLQSRFVEGVEKLGRAFPSLSRPRLPEQDWLGALHFIELVDCTEDVHKKMHAVFAPAVPRIGELVTPEKGSPMRVVDVDHVAITQGDREGLRQPSLVPHVYLEAIADSE